MVIVLLSYDILALSQRKNIDDQSLDGLFYDYSQPLPNIEIAQALNQLLNTISGISEEYPNMIESLSST